MNALSSAVQELEATLRRKEQKFHRALNIKLIPHPVMLPGGLILNDLHEAVGFVEKNLELKEALQEHRAEVREAAQTLGEVSTDLQTIVGNLKTWGSKEHDKTKEEFSSEVQNTLALVESCLSALKEIGLTDG